MAVDRIVQYRQKDGKDTLKVFLQPSKRFPKGSYFYCDAEDLDLVREYAWYLNPNSLALEAGYNNVHIHFHQEVAFKRLGHFVDCVDHYNHCPFDNCEVNLFNVTAQENCYNRQECGYTNYLKKCWSVALRIPDGKNITKPAVNEFEACKLRCQLEKQYLLYSYSFLEDRSNAIDILDLERTGQISHEEAVYRHVKRYSQNAWYYYRYDLADYFKEYNIPVPEFTLDERGFMIDVDTGRKLCPRWKELRNLDRSVNMIEDLLQTAENAKFLPVFASEHFLPTNILKAFAIGQIFTDCMLQPVYIVPNKVIEEFVDFIS